MVFITFHIQLSIAVFVNYNATTYSAIATRGAKRIGSMPVAIEKFFVFMF
jgi:hypothetical protein